MKNITKRDIKSFLFGMLAMFLILLAYDWKEFVAGFNAGFNDTQNKIESNN